MIFKGVDAVVTDVWTPVQGSSQRHCLHLFHVDIPFIKGAVQWYLMCGIAVDTTFFGGIACALSTLHRQSQEWTEDELISILDEMTSKYTQRKIVGWLADTVIS